MTDALEQPKGRWTRPVCELAILVGLCAWVFWPQLAAMASRAARSAGRVHGLAAPIALALLIWCRRSALPALRPRGSLAGGALVLAGLALFSAATWPFDYGYARDVAILPALAGAVVIACGWRVLRFSLPALLLLLLAIPVSTRLYLSLVVRPEAYTLLGTAKALDLLPGLRAGVRGTDVIVAGARGAHVLGLGGSRWASELLVPFAAIGVFVTFCRIRSVGRIVWVALAAVPIVLLCNFLRLLVWALIAVYADLDVTATLPRYVSTAVSMLAAYGLFLLACTARLGLFVETPEADEDGGEAPPAPARPRRPVAEARRGRAFLSVRFLLPAGGLLLAALGLRPAMAALSEEYAKTPIDLRRRLEDFDVSRLASFRDGWEHSWPKPPFEAVGTEQCIYLELHKKGTPELLGTVGLSVKYYSQSGDKVPHTPDVCSRQAGATVVPQGTVTIDLAGADPARRSIRAGVLLQKWKKYNHVIVYSFLVEGRFVTSRRHARWLVARPGNRRTYHGMVMATTPYRLDETSDRALRTCKKLLGEALPILLADHFPDPERLKRR